MFESSSSTLPIFTAKKCASDIDLCLKYQNSRNPWVHGFDIDEQKYIGCTWQSVKALCFLFSDAAFRTRLNSITAAAETLSRTSCLGSKIEHPFHWEDHWEVGSVTELSPCAMRLIRTTNNERQKLKFTEIFCVTAKFAFV
jgi:hypothetical protein